MATAKYTKEVRDKNRSNANKRVKDGKLVDKGDMPMSKRQKALAKSRKSKKTTGTTRTY